jgi:hypothetical protein
MDDGEDEYGPERIGPDGIRERKVLPGKRRRRQPFVMVPLAWIEQLSKPKHRASWPVALELLRRNLRHNGQPFPLANGQLEAKFRINRTQKWEALRELEQLDLIRIENRPRKSPMVTISNRTS